MSLFAGIELTEEQKRKRELGLTGDDDKEGTFQEIAEGVASGLIAIPQGVGELGASLVDLAADTNYAQDVTNLFEGFREAAGIDPEGAAGEIAEAATQFLVPVLAPGVGSVALVSKFSKAKNLSKGMERLAQIGAAGLVDAAVSTTGNTTIGDFFEGGPTQTVDLIGLEGRDAALARIGNKLRFGVEAAGATALAEPLFKVLGAGTSRTIGAVAGPTSARAARATLEAGTALATSGSKLLQKIPGVSEETLEKVASAFRFRGNLTEEMAEARSQIRGKIEKQINYAARTVEDVNRGINDLYDPGLGKGKLSEIMVGQTSLTRADLNNEIYSYLTGETTIDMIPEAIRRPVMRMRRQVDRMSNQILKSDFLNNKESEDIAAEIKANIGSYLRRKYRFFEDEGFKKTTEFAEAKEDTIKMFEQSPDVYRSFYERVYNSGKAADELPVAAPEEHFFGVGAGEKVKRSEAEALVEDFLRIGSQKRGAYSSPKGNNRVAVDRLKTDLFKAKRVGSPAIRRMLGEIKDPQEAFISTVTDMAEFVANDEFMYNIARSAKDSGSVLTSDAYKALPPELRREYTVLSEDYWGTAKDVAVSNRMYMDLTRVVATEDETVKNVARGLYSGFLKAKGASQFTKTVLSPITQIRNVTSAAMFAVAQGNIGRGAGLGESFAIVANNIRKRGDSIGYYGKLQELGVIGNQAQLREIDRLLSEGLGVTREADEVVAGVQVGRKPGNIFSRSKILNLARQGYQGGDDVWKIYNFEFEKSKLLSKFGSVKNAERAVGMNIDEYAANIVKNNVPNYERVPQIIKEIRKLPVGNFIAFPAEIIRTSVNTLQKSLDEIAVRADDPDFLARFSDIADEGERLKAAQQAAQSLNEIGMRRLTGLAFATTALPVALQETAKMLTGVTQDQLDAARRAGPEWSRNSRLIPVSVDDEGNLKGYVDFSYTNPYDYLQRPIMGIYNAISDGQDLGKDSASIAANAGFQALNEIFNPFASESIVTEKLVDTTIRGGRTKTGARVYRDVDTSGDKLLKSFVHTMEAFNPGGSPFELKAQKKTTQAPGIEPGRFVRGMLNLGPDPAGNERKAAGEFLRALTGLTEIEVKPDNIVMYSSFDYAGNITGARQLFNTAVKTRGSLTEDEALNAYQNANEALFRVQSKMHQTVKDMRALGMGDFEIRKALKKYKIGNVSQLMRGDFVPMKISKETRREVRENGNSLPLVRLNGMRFELGNRKLSSFEEPRETRTLDLPAVTPAPNAGAQSPGAAIPPLAAPAPAPTPATGGIFAGIKLTPQQQQRRAALAGNNPATQQLAQRQP